MNDPDNRLTDENGLRGVYAEPAKAVRDKSFPHLDRHSRRYIELSPHCSKALRRSDLWNPDKRLPKSAFPTLGQIARDQFKLLVPAKLIDLALQRDAKKNLY